MKQRNMTVLALAISSALVACSDSDDAPPSSAGADTRRVSASFSGLDDLGEDFVYEGWLIAGGQAISAGRFSANGSGSTSFNFDIDRAVADTATAYVLTIEPAEGDDPAPAATHVLAGDLIAERAALSIGHAAALGTDFTAATGVFGLAVPSDDTGTGSYRNGIWYLQQPGPAAGLSLPTLPAGWAYEGWVVDAGGDGPISTGRFTAVDEADSDGAGESGGNNASPGYPGQDFIHPAPRDLIGLAAVISVEPEPDNSPLPFGIKPLVDGEIEDVGPLPATQPIALAIADNQPTGNVEIR